MNTPKIFGLVAARYFSMHDKPLADNYPACWGLSPRR